MKKLSLVLVAVMLLCQLVVSAEEPGIQVAFDCSKVEFEDTRPQMIQSRVMVPLRAIFEKLGAEVHWNGENQTITAQKGDKTVRLTIDEKQAYVNQSPIELDVPATIVNERTLVPVRFISESMGAYVSWNQFSQTVYIYSPEYLGDLNFMQLNLILNQKYSNKMVDLENEFVTVNDREMEIPTDFGRIQCFNTVTQQEDQYDITCGINMYQVNQICEGLTKEEQQRLNEQLGAFVKEVAEISVAATGGNRKLIGGYAYKENDEIQLFDTWRYSPEVGYEVKDDWK